MNQIGLQTENPPHRPLGFSSRDGRLGGLVVLVAPLLLPATVFFLGLAKGFGVAVSFALRAFFVVVLIYVFLAGAARIGQMLLAMIENLSYTRSRRLGMEWPLPASSERIPPISILVWTHNQGADLPAYLEQLLRLEYPQFEIVVINDGSNDNTLNILHSSLDLHPVHRIFRRMIPTAVDGTIYGSEVHPHLTVVDKSWSGRSDSLNFALNLAQYPYVLIADPSVALHRTGLARLARGIIEDKGRTIAVSGLAEAVGVNEKIGDEALSGSARPAPGVVAPAGGFLQQFDGAARASGWIETLQKVDRLGLMYSGWLSRTYLSALMVSEGVVHLFKKSEASAVGGFDMEVEDGNLNLLLAMQSQQKGDRRVAFIPDTIAQVRVSDDLGPTSEAQRRWQSRALDAVFSNWRIAVKPGTGFLQRLAFPVFLFVDVLGPILESLGCLTIAGFFILGRITKSAALQFIDPADFLLLVFAVLAFAVIQSVGGVLCEEYSERSANSPGELLRLIAVGVLHAFTYRQASAWWKLNGVIDYVLKRRM